ncbi:MAG TPA: ABC transporter permease subunit, partial [Pseudonocardiaceae bacterium]
MSTFLTGVRTVAAQEFRLRLRAGRWRWLLASWLVVVTAFTVAVRLSLSATAEAVRDDSTEPFGTPMYGALMLLVLGLGLLIVPALTAQSVNGDRERGTLATLQVTLLRPAEIAVGKLVAAWATSLVFLALTLPLVVWCVAEGGVPGGRLVVTLLVVALLLGVTCAIAQCLSAVLVRSTTSAVLSYLVVFALTIGTLIVFGLATAMTQERVERTVTYPDTRESYTYTTTQSRTDKVWWLLAPNPFVVLADAAPALPHRIDPVTGWREPVGFDPLGEIGRAVRELRLPPAEPMAARYSDAVVEDVVTEERAEGKWVWPYGLALNVLLGAAALAVTTRRLRT